jgi:diamine N-acetyltransferase
MIYGKDVRLRSIEPDDLPRFVSWFNDTDVREGLSQFLPMSLVEEEKWFEDFISRDPLEKPFAIDVLEDEAWVHVGSAGLFTFDHQARRAELGIAIGAKQYWDRGHGTNAVRLLLRHAFENLNLNRVSLVVFESNPRAIHVYKKSVLSKKEGCASFTFPVDSIVIR